MSRFSQKGEINTNPCKKVTILIYKQHLQHVSKRRKEEPCGEIEWIKEALPVKQEEKDDNSYLQVPTTNNRDGEITLEY